MLNRSLAPSFVVFDGDILHKLHCYKDTGSIANLPCLDRDPAGEVVQHLLPSRLKYIIHPLGQGECHLSHGQDDGKPTVRNDCAPVDTTRPEHRKVTLAPRVAVRMGISSEAWLQGPYCSLYR